MSVTAAFLGGLVGARVAWELSPYPSRPGSCYAVATLLSFFAAERHRSGFVAQLCAAFSAGMAMQSAMQGGVLDDWKAFNLWLELDDTALHALIRVLVKYQGPILLAWARHSSQHEIRAVAAQRFDTSLLFFPAAGCFFGNAIKVMVKTLPHLYQRLCRWKAVPALALSEKFETWNIVRQIDDRIFIMFHGTTKESAAEIVRHGFQPSAGGLLGPGVYMTRDVLKTQAYARGAILECRVRVGKTVNVAKNPALCRTWHAAGYDSAFLPDGNRVVQSGRSEDCIFDPKRIEVVDVYGTDSAQWGLIRSVF